MPAANEMTDWTAAAFGENVPAKPPLSFHPTTWPEPKVPPLTLMPMSWLRPALAVHRSALPEMMAYDAADGLTTSFMCLRVSRFL